MRSSTIVATRIWLSLMALPLSAALTESNRRIVDFGADLGWGQLPYRGRAVERPVQGVVDRDGDGTTANDFVSCWPFSLSEPLNPPGLRYDTDQKNARFFGGLTLYSCNPFDPAHPRSISEGHLNSNHELRDDLNFMGGLEPYGSHELVEAYGTWFWKKEDFLGGGSSHPVSFNAESRLAVQVSRYWGGFNAGRWLVRDGETFYLSRRVWKEMTRQVCQDSVTHEDAGQNPVVHTSHILVPAETDWAVYHPEPPFRIEFDVRRASFRSHVFTNVTAVGFFVSRELTPPRPVSASLRPPFALKWNAFRCDAVVRGQSPDSVVEMVPVAKADGAVAFYMGRGEVSFRQWERIRRIAVTSQYCVDLGDLGYSFDRDGAMGSMAVDAMPHGVNEPVTEIAWSDAVAFCNALSEYEGLKPAYYLDAEFRSPLRRTVDRDVREHWYRHARVFWNRKAGGYRLPTREEWLYAAGKGGEANSGGWVKATAGGTTHPVATSRPNSQGICDLLGNVWEYVWPGGDVVDVDGAKEMMVYGGSYQYPDPPGADPQGGKGLWAGSASIGFRIVRSSGPGGEVGAPAGELPQWRITREEKGVVPDTAAVARDLASAIRFVSLPVGLASDIDTLAPEIVAERNRKISQAHNDRFLKRITPEAAAEIIKANTPPGQRTRYPLECGQVEISYRVWQLARGWAESHGYAFNYAGDRGSMRHGLGSDHAFSQEEPVTGISWYDAVVWCNAASHLMGRRPAYYADQAFLQPYRTSLWFRLEMFADQGGPNMPWNQRQVGKGERLHTGAGDRVYFDPTATGLRLPLDIEFQAFNTAPVNADVEHEWTGINAGDKTHPVGSRAPALNGMYDLNGNVFEWAWDSKIACFEFQNASYAINGQGYFFEPYTETRPRRANAGSYSESAAVARSFVGFRVVARQAEGVVK